MYRTIKQKINIERCVLAVMKKSGWSHKKAVSEMKYAKSKYGISFRDFERARLYNELRIDYDKRYKKYLKQKVKKRRVEEKKQRYISKIMQQTGWTEEYTRKVTNEAMERTGCLLKEFYTYRFFEIDKALQDQLFLICHSSLISKRFNTDKEFVDTVFNKEKTNKQFSEVIKRKWCVNHEVSLKEFESLFSGEQKVVYKPAVGNRGIGVETFEINKNIYETFDRISALPRGVVEQFITQHPKMSQLTPNSVNSLRIVTISANGGPVCGDNDVIVYIAVRIGNGVANVDNFHRGGMAAGVDLDSGIVVTKAADYEGNAYDVHPVSKAKFKGFEIPMFDEAKELVVNTCRRNRISGYLGWDIALTKNGVELIEINTMPGVVLLTAPYRQENQGMKSMMEKYFKM